MRRFYLTEDGWRNETLDEVLTSSLSRAARQKRYREGKQGPIIQAIVERDGLVCGICAQAIEVEHAEIDHIIPTSLGGHPDDVANLQLAHPRCNVKKGAHGTRRHETLPPLPGVLRIQHAT
jgi:5-methylcytosine-specific restriction endonuclease McrA